MAKQRKSLIVNYFKPSIYVRSFKDVNVSQLKRQGIKLFISDLDNTLVPHYTRLPNKDNKEFIKKVKDAGIEFVLMSNNVKKRVSIYAEKAGIDDYYWNAKKPFTKTVKTIIEKHNLKPSEIIIMGDQIIMDILVANRMKVESILVQPLVSTNYKMSAFNIFLENKIYKKLSRENILTQGEFSHLYNDSLFELL